MTNERAYTPSLVLHVLRNPHGWSAEAITAARLQAADEIERLRDALKRVRRVAAEGTTHTGMIAALGILVDRALNPGNGPLPPDYTYHSHEPGACGIKCTHCNGNGTKLQVFDAELFDGWSPEDEPCETCNGAGRITTVEQYLKTLPADWHQDSSVETWFPMLNEEVERLRRAEKSCMEHHISQGASRDASSGEG